MAKQTKSLKKYAKKHLSDTIAKRKQLRPVINEMKARKERKREKSKEGHKKAEVDHMDQLQALEEEDQEFMEYLKIEDPQLLNFGAADQFSEDEPLEDDEAEKEESSALPPSATISRVEIDAVLTEAFQANTSSSADEWLSHLQAKNKISINTLKKVLKLQRRLTDALVSEGPLENLSLYAIANVQIVKFLPIAITRIHETTHSEKKPTKGTQQQSLSYEYFTAVSKETLKIPFSPNLEALVKRYLTNIATYSKYLLGVDLRQHPEALDNTLLPPLFGRLSSFVNSLPSYSRMLKIIVKLAVRSVCAVEKGYETRIAAVSFLLQVLSSKKNLHLAKEKIFKQIFVSLIDSVPNYQAGRATAIKTIITDMATLLGEDLVIAYQTIFVYLKKLSDFVRSALVRTNDPKVKASVLNWQFVIALRAIGETLCKYPKEKELWALIYPFTQICLGSLEILNSAVCVPFQLHVFDVLQNVADTTRLHIPLTPYFLRILKYKAFQTKPKPSSKESKESDFQQTLPYVLRIDKYDWKLTSVQGAVLDRLLCSIARHTSRYAYSVTFPELFCILHHDLKKMGKDLPHASHSMVIAKYMRAVNLTEEIVRERRKSVDFGPTDVTKMNIWEAAFRDEVPSLPLVELV